MSLVILLINCVYTIHYPSISAFIIIVLKSVSQKQMETLPPFAFLSLRTSAARRQIFLEN